MDKESYGLICIKDDCQMYDHKRNGKKPECKGLKKLYCRTEKCNFYKPYKHKM